MVRADSLEIGNAPAKGDPRRFLAVFRSSEEGHSVLVGMDWKTFDARRAALAKLGIQPVTLQTYPEAVHGFDSPGSRLRYRDDVRNRNKPGGCCGAWVGYHETSYRDASRRLQAFFAQWLGR